MALAAAALCSCGGGKGDAELDAEIGKFEQVCDRGAELGAKVKAGDLSVADEFADVAAEMSDRAQDLAAHALEMTPEQAGRMRRAAEKAEAAVRD